MNELKVPNHLFVYGTLKKGFENEIADYLLQTQTFLGEGHFPGILFKVSFYPGAVYLPEVNSKVYGHVFRIGENSSKLFEILDEYEGVGERFTPPHEFVRKVIPIHFKQKEIRAFSYLFNDAYQSYPVIESGNFTPGTS